MIHCRTLLEAAIAANTACLAWEDRKTGETWTMKKLAAAAQPVLEDGDYYVVSREGAIGLAKGAEYRTTWLLLPHDEATQQEILQSIKQDFISESDRIEGSPLAQEAAELAKQAEAAKQTAAPTPPAPAPKPEEKLPELTLDPDLIPDVFSAIVEPELIFEAAKPAEKPITEPDVTPLVLNIPTYRTAKLMAEAAKMATGLCSGWCQPSNTKQGYDAMMLKYICGQQDTKRPLGADAGSYYLVSPEGAIGLTEDDGAHISWLLLPMNQPSVNLPSSIPSAAPTSITSVQPPAAPEPPAPFGKQETAAEPEKQRFCPKCGKPVSAKGKFCMSCGNRLDKPTPAKPICANCGAELNIGSKFCVKCGTRVSS